MIPFVFNVKWHYIFCMKMFLTSQFVIYVSPAILLIVRNEHKQRWLTKNNEDNWNATKNCWRWQHCSHANCINMKNSMRIIYNFIFPNDFDYAVLYVSNENMIKFWKMYHWIFVVKGEIFMQLKILFVLDDYSGWHFVDKHDA